MDGPPGRPAGWSFQGWGRRGGCQGRPPTGGGREEKQRRGRASLPRNWLLTRSLAKLWKGPDNTYVRPRAAPASLELLVSLGVCAPSPTASPPTPPTPTAAHLRPQSYPPVPSPPLFQAPNRLQFPPYWLTRFILPARPGDLSHPADRGPFPSFTARYRLNRPLPAKKDVFPPKWLSSSIMYTDRRRSLSRTSSESQPDPRDPPRRREGGPRNNPAGLVADPSLAPKR